MVFCVQVVAATSTVARRDQLRTALQSARAGRSTWGPLMDEVTVTLAGTHQLRVELRFVAAADQTEFFALAETEVRKVALAGSTLTRHDCSHDTENSPCVVAAGVVI